MTFTDTIKKVSESRFFDYRYQKYTNSVSLNGYLIVKPRGIDLMKGRHVVVFNLIQINNDNSYTYYPCQVYSKELQKQLMELKNVCLVNVLGRLTKNTRTIYAIQVEEMVVSHEFVDKGMELLDIKEHKSCESEQD